MAASAADLPRCRASRIATAIASASISGLGASTTARFFMPAAMWAEKIGTYTNTDRTVHISLKAVDPPGEARSDLDIFLDFARRMNFEDKDGAALIKWNDPEGAFEAWKKCSEGHFCDYSGITYARLTGGSGIQWPCNKKAPDGTERLYADGKFNTTIDSAEQFGHDLVTGGALTPEQFEGLHAEGRAILKTVDYEPPVEEPDAERDERGASRPHNARPLPYRGASWSFAGSLDGSAE